jgi:hypothetical protein
MEAAAAAAQAQQAAQQQFMMQQQQRQQCAMQPPNAHTVDRPAMMNGPQVYGSSRCYRSPVRVMIDCSDNDLLLAAISTGDDSAVAECGILSQFAPRQFAFTRECIFAGNADRRATTANGTASMGESTTGTRPAPSLTPCICK